MFLKNRKGFTLVELIVGIMIITSVSVGILNVLQTGKNTRYINKANQDITILHSNILNYLDIKNNDIKNSTNKGIYNFNEEVKREFLSNFPNNSLNLLDEKKCYSLNNTGNEFIFTEESIDSDEFVNASNSSLSIDGKNEVDSEYGYTYPTILCIQNGYSINNNISNVKNITSGPVLVTLFSNYILSGDVINIHSEKKYYFEEK